MSPVGSPHLIPPVGTTWTKRQSSAPLMGGIKVPVTSTAASTVAASLRLGEAPRRGGDGAGRRAWQLPDSTAWLC